MKNKMMNENGFTLFFAVLAAGAAAVMIMSIARLFQQSSRELNYIGNMERVFYLSETGLNNGISELIYDSSKCSDPAFSLPHTYPEVNKGEEYSNQCFRRDQPQAGSFYIITNARYTVDSKVYSQTLHSYVAISHVSEYFAAVNGDLQISFPTDLGSGKVYAQNKLTFDTGEGANKTVLARAEFFQAISPAFANGTDWSANTPNPRLAVKIGPTLNDSPIKLPNPILFPQVTGDDLLRYKQLAGPHIVTSNFAGNIYPPGYEDPKGSDDTYALHTTNNAQHVYYFEGDMRIGAPASTVTIHGQILFVATGKIIIDGAVISSQDMTFMPGAKFPSSSTAHQAVFIPGPTQNIEVSSNFYRVGEPNPQYQYIEGLFLAPTGTINCMKYYDAAGNEDSVLMGNLGVRFTGSMILGKMPNFREVFIDSTQREYRYMQTLKTNQPPYLPALSVILNEFPDITSQAGIYN